MVRGPSSGKRGKAAYGELGTPLRLKVGAIIFKRQGSSKKLPAGLIGDLAREYDVDKRTIQRIGLSFRTELPGQDGIDLHRHRRKVCGRPKMPLSAIKSRIAAISPCKRRNIRGMAIKAELAPTTMFKALKRLKAHKCRRWLRPCLSEKQKLARLEWIVGLAEKRGREWDFPDFDHWVHVDEKWFYLVKDGERIYVLPEEAPPGAPRVQNKRFITKVMFLAAIGRPHRHHNGRAFDGKVGIWPFVETAVAERTSKNRPAGTEFLRPRAVDGEAWRDMMLQNVLPAVKAAFGHAKRSVVVQMDGAKPHIKGSIQSAIATACNADGFRITLKKQPANSPDFNILDLGFFHSLQQRATALKEGGEISDLVGAVEAAFWEEDPRVLERVWQALFGVLNATLEHKGDNDFSVPHQGTGGAQRRGELPRRARVNRVFLTQAQRILARAEKG